MLFIFDIVESLVEVQLKNFDFLIIIWLLKYFFKWVVVIFCELNYWENKLVKQLNSKEVEVIVGFFEDWQIYFNGIEGYCIVEVIFGGVDIDELLLKIMMSKKVEQLFFIGEVVDVIGWLGGYNFQWVWSSGWVVV